MTRDGTIGLVHDVDADGVTAGVVWQRVLERLNFKVARLSTNRERNVWTESNRAKIAAVAPNYLWVLDLGCRDEKVIEGVPTAFLDHHRPEGVLPADTLITGYGWPCVPNTSWMTYELARGKVENEDCDWIAVIGTLSDLGEKAPWLLIGEAKKKYTAKWLKEATALVNAPRRASNFNPEAAARALTQFDNPKDLCNSDAPDVQILKSAREEVKSEMNEGQESRTQIRRSGRFDYDQFAVPDSSAYRADLARASAQISCDLRQYGLHERSRQLLGAQCRRFERARFPQELRAFGRRRQLRSRPRSSVGRNSAVRTLPRTVE